MKLLRIADIRRDGGTQTRTALDFSTVTDYAEAMKDGARFPPITVYYDGSVYWLADGFHRVAAARQIGTVELDAEIIQGTRRDAILHSVGANTMHGLRRTNADKRRAVETLLRDDEWSKWSDREIARRCGVDHTFVGRIRSSLETNTSENDRPRTYTTKHGTTAQMRTENIGRPTATTVDADGVFHIDTGDDWPGGFYENEDEDGGTTVEYATEDIRDYIESKLNQLGTITERHEVVNATLKHLRSLSVKYNQEV